MASSDGGPEPWEPDGGAHSTRRRGGASDGGHHYRRARGAPRGPAPPRRRRPLRRRTSPGLRIATVVQVVVLLAVPAILGVAFGFFEINPRQAELLAPAGSEAHLLLEPFPDDRLVVEIAYQASAGPPPGNAIAHLFYEINETCQKATVTLDLHAFTSDQVAFGLGDLLSIEESVRQQWPTWGTMSLFYLYLNGYYQPQPSVLGEAFRGSSIAIFEARIAQTTLSPYTVAEVTNAVMVHELGHDLGLVGVDGYAANEDATHPGASADPADVMYWAVDTAGFTGNLTGPAPTNFTAADLNDLRNVRAAVIVYELLPWAVLAASFLAAGVVFVVARRDRPAAPAS